MEKVKVAVLGATGSVGQKFIELLNGHPWFEIHELGASERSAGKKYIDATNWIMQTPLPESVANMVVKECKPGFEAKVIFSGLDSSVAGEIETEFAEAGYTVISNARNHRTDADVPLVIPEVNPDHLELAGKQKYKGKIITNPNCSTIGMVTSLKPLHDAFTIEKINVVTMQAVSGGGYPGISSMDIMNNVLPYISGEEDKLENEPRKILGKFNGSGIEFAEMEISAQCNRVPVIDGHTETIQLKFKNKPSKEDIIAAWENFRAEPQELGLPFAPEKPVVYFREEKYPQPRIHSNLGRGMTAATGRLRECPLFDYKYVALSHNTVRGAAGGTILIAELMYKKGTLV